MLIQRKYLGILILIPLLSSCAAKKAAGPTVVPPPKLVTVEDHMKAVHDKLQANSGNPFAQMEAIQGMMTDMMMFSGIEGRSIGFCKKGKNIKMSEQVVNEGGPSVGMRFLIRGTALSTALVGAPTKVTFTSYEDPPRQQGGLFANLMMGEGKVLDEKEVTAFVPSTNGSWAGNLKDFGYQSKINISVTLPSQQAGKGDLHLDVFPADAEGSTRVNFVDHITVVDSMKIDDSPSEDDSE